jgi:hypothetical protein
MSKRQTTTKFFILVILFLILSSSSISAQEKKSLVEISGMFAHYSDNSRNINTNSYPSSFITPGIEIQYIHLLDSCFWVSSGVGYQYVSLVSDRDEIDKFQFGEISLFLGFELRLFNTKGNSISLSSGINGGKFIDFRWTVPSKTGWHEALLQNMSRYSEDNYFSDIYFSLNYQPFVNNRNNLVLSPFIKYRIRDNWINYYIEKIHYGIKLSYTIGM